MLDFVLRRYRLILDLFAVALAGVLAWLVFVPSRGPAWRGHPLSELLLGGSKEGLERIGTNAIPCYLT